MLDFLIFFFPLFRERSWKCRRRIICIRSGTKAWDDRKIKSDEFRPPDNLRPLSQAEGLVDDFVLTSKANLDEIQRMEEKCRRNSAYSSLGIFVSFMM